MLVKYYAQICHLICLISSYSVLSLDFREPENAILDIFLKEKVIISGELSLSLESCFRNLSTSLYKMTSNRKFKLENIKYWSKLVSDFQ